MKQKIRITIGLFFIWSCIGPFAQMARGQAVLSPVVFGPAEASVWVVKGLKIFPDDPLKMDFVVDTERAGTAWMQEEIKQESNKLIQYFLAGLTVPSEDLWVNLNPEQPDRITTEKFGQTRMGRDLLAQDFILKQMTSALLSPDSEMGEKFWEAIYAKIYEKKIENRKEKIEKTRNQQSKHQSFDGDFLSSNIYPPSSGNLDIFSDLMSRVWIVPDKVVVAENGNTAYVREARLRVQLDTQRNNVTMQQCNNDKACIATLPQANEESDVALAHLKNLIVPVIEKEVNEGAAFAPLRQIYYSLILATWFKQNLRQTVLGQAYADRNLIDGVDIENPNEKEEIFQQYLEIFQKGLHEQIREEYDPVTQSIVPKKYIVGGVELQTELAMLVEPLGNNILKGHNPIDVSVHYNPLPFSDSSLAEKAMLVSFPGGTASGWSFESLDVTLPTDTGETGEVVLKNVRRLIPDEKGEKTVLEKISLNIRALSSEERIEVSEQYRSKILLFAKHPHPDQLKIYGFLSGEYVFLREDIFTAIGHGIAGMLDDPNKILNFNIDLGDLPERDQLIRLGAIFKTEKNFIMHEMMNFYAPIRGWMETYYSKNFGARASGSVRGDEEMDSVEVQEEGDRAWQIEAQKVKNAEDRARHLSDVLNFFRAWSYSEGGEYELGIIFILMKKMIEPSVKEIQQSLPEQMLLRMSPEAMPWDVKEIIERALGRIEAFFSRLGKKEIVREQVIVKDLIRQSVANASLSADVQVHVFIEDESSSVFIDEHKIMEVLVNLIKNAKEAMDGKVLKEGEAHQLEISVKKNDAGDSVVFEIVDTGKGISSESLSRIFDYHFTEGKAGGTGVGLYLSRQIVEAHGGKIWAESEVGKGSTFFIELPLIESDKKANDQETPEAAMIAARFPEPGRYSYPVYSASGRVDGLATQTILRLQVDGKPYAVVLSWVQSESFPVLRSEQDTAEKTRQFYRGRIRRPVVSGSHKAILDVHVSPGTEPDMITTLEKLPHWGQVQCEIVEETAVLKTFQLKPNSGSKQMPEVQKILEDWFTTVTSQEKSFNVNSKKFFGRDNAVLASLEKDLAPGGIDLNLGQSGVDWYVQQDQENTAVMQEWISVLGLEKFSGLTPVVVSVTPLVDIGGFLR